MPERRSRHPAAEPATRLSSEKVHGRVQEVASISTLNYHDQRKTHRTLKPNLLDPTPVYGVLHEIVEELGANSE
eukprot:506623-Rhodomonas_salina.1